MDMNTITMLMRFLVAAISLVVTLPKAIKYIRRVIRHIKRK